MKLPILSLLILVGTVRLYAADPIIREINSPQEFQEAINGKKDSCIIFYAPWCGACNAMKETFAEAAKHFSGDVDFIKVDASNEKLKEAVDTFGIQAIPTVFLKHVGAQDKDSFIKRLEGFTGKTRKATPKKELTKKLVRSTPKKLSRPHRKVAQAPKRPTLKKIAIPRSHKV
jgi:thiol-disulfide isomerase/thioredoxin